MLAKLLIAMVVGGTTPTDFGLRMVGQPATSITPGKSQRLVTDSGDGGGAFRISAAATVGARFGRVTSTIRSPEHNRRVGGVRNSWHLHGRAIDIARRSSVSHAELAAALRNAGLHLIESLDEGDHSHFAFGDRPGPLNRRARAEQQAEVSAEATYFRFVVAPGSRSAASR